MPGPVATRSSPSACTRASIAFAELMIGEGLCSVSRGSGDVKRLTIIYCSCEIEVNALSELRDEAREIRNCATTSGSLAKEPLPFGSKPYTENGAMSSKTSQLK